MQLLEIPIGLHFPSLLFEKIGTCMSLKHVLPTHSDAQQQKNENAIGSNYFHPRFGERDYKSPDFGDRCVKLPLEMIKLLLLQSRFGAYGGCHKGDEGQVFNLFDAFVDRSIQNLKKGIVFGQL